MQMTEEVGMFLLLYLFCTLLFLFLFWILFLIRSAKCPADTDPSLFTHYAHRGLHGEDIPENSLAAFRNAVSHGYGIELDLQLSADGEVMVFHDYTLDRMTGETGKLSDRTAEELRKLRLLRRDGTPSDETIPTLTEVLRTVDGRVPLLIELKGESTDFSLCPAANRILQTYSGAYCVESFNPLLLRWYKRNRPDVFRGLLYTDLFRGIKKSFLNLLLSGMLLNMFARPHFISYDIRFPKKLPVLLTTSLFKAPHFLWTIRSEEECVDGSPMIFENILPSSSRENLPG